MVFCVDRRQIDLCLFLTLSFISSCQVDLKLCLWGRGEKSGGLKCFSPIYLNLFAVETSMGSIIYSWLSEVHKENPCVAGGSKHCICNITSGLWESSRNFYQMLWEEVSIPWISTWRGDGGDGSEDLVSNLFTILILWVLVGLYSIPGEVVIWTKRNFVYSSH